MKNNSFENNFTLTFRSKLYDKCKVLVNDMGPVIKEVDLFIKHILLSPLKGDSKVTYRILDTVDLYVERTNETVKEYGWCKCTHQHLDHVLLVVDYENIDEMFEPFKSAFMDILIENDIQQDFPSVLLTKAFLCFIESIGYYLEAENIDGEENIYNIIKMGNNGECNIIL